MIHPNADYLKDNWNSTDSMIKSIFQLYSGPFYANLTFDNYQEAVAYKQLWVDSPLHPKWYTPTLDCNPKKINLPLEIKDILLKK